MNTPTPSSAAQRPFLNSYLYDYSNEHVLYELCQFYGILNVLRDQSCQSWETDPSRSTMIMNTFVEGFALHFRTIIDYLFPGPSQQPTDIIASDFCPPGAWNHKFSNMPQSLKDARTRANKEIAHLTSNRSLLTDSNRLWYCDPLSQEVTSVLQHFSEQADEDKLGDQVFNFIGNL
jgi:hypothetical protein